MPSKNIVDFANQVKSYAFGIKDQQVLGAWNQLDYTASSQNINGVDFTVNADKTITVNIEGDAATDVAALELVPNGSPLPQNWKKIIGKRVYLNCFFSGGSLSTIWFFINCRNSSNVTIVTYQYIGNEVPITIPEGTATIRMALAIAPAAGKLTNFIVKPMISLEPNQPYVPYAMTNRELTEVEDVTSKVTFSNNVVWKPASTGWNSIYRCGKVVYGNIRFETPDVVSDDLTVLTVPDDLMPAAPRMLLGSLIESSNNWSGDNCGTITYIGNGNNFGLGYRGWKASKEVCCTFCYLTK